MATTIQNVNHLPVSAVAQARNNIVPLERKLKVQEVPKVMWLSFLNPQIAKMNVASWLSYPAPLAFGVPLMAGLVARALSDDKFKKHEIPNDFIRTLRDSYPLFYLGMLLCGLVNGVAYSSISRILSYSLLSLGSIYLWNSESKRNQASEQLIYLNKAPDFPGKEKQIQQLHNQLSDSTAGIATYSRIYYCFAMFFTFLANVTQQTRIPSLKYPGASTSMRPLEFLRDFRANFKDIASRELKAGWHYTKGLFTPDGIKTFVNGISGRDAAFEAELDTKNIPKSFLRRFPMRMGHPDVNSYFTMANGVLRATTVMGTFITALGLNGIDIFNHGTALEKPETARLVAERPLLKKAFDVFMFLNNIGMFLMGLCSFATGLNLNYQRERGMLAAFFQIATGALYSGAAVADQLEMFLPGVALKVGGNIAAQYANITATAGSAFGGLTAAGLVK